MPRVKTYGGELGGTAVDQAGMNAPAQQAANVGGVSLDAFLPYDRQQQADAERVGARIKAQIQQQQDSDDADAVFTAKNQLRSELQTIREQASQRQGKNAAGVADDVDRQLNEARDRIMGNMGNDRQRRLLWQDSEQIRLATRDSMFDYEQRHVEHGKLQEWKASKELAVQGALSNPTVANLQATEAEIIRSNQFMAQQRGWSDAELKAENMQDLQKMHTGVVQMLMDADRLGEAQKYITIHGDKLDPGVVSRVKAQVKEKGEQNSSRAEAATYIEQAGGDYGKGVQAIRDKYGNTAYGDKVMSQFKYQFAENRMIEEEDRRQSLEAVDQEAHEKNGLRYVSQESIDRLKPSDRRDFEEKRTKEIENLSMWGTPYARQTNSLVMQQYEKQVEAGDITDIKQLSGLVPYATRADFEAMATLIKKQGEISDNEIKTEFRTTMGITGDITGANYQKYLALRAHVAEQMRQGKITKAELPLVVDKFIVDYNNSTEWTKKTFDVFKDTLEVNDENKPYVDAERRSQNYMTRSEDPEILRASETARLVGLDGRDPEAIMMVQRAESYLRSQGKNPSQQDVANYINSLKKKEAK